MELTVRIIDGSRKEDINLKNQPFSIFGRLLPSYQDGVWTSREERFPEERVTQTCFPEEEYDYDAMKDDHTFVGVYDGEACVGLAILERPMFRYLYLLDLKVNADYRGRGAGRLLVEKCMEVSRDQGYRGVYTIGQGNNLGACRFYLNNGFVIGGLDTKAYTGTKLEGDSDVIFYRDNG